jgi:hypothetical protein
VIYELRSYTPYPDRMDDLLDRFRGYTLGLFQRCGLEAVGYWTDEPGTTLHYLLRHADAAAAAASWAQVKVESDAHEPFEPLLAEKVVHYLEPTDFSPLP